MLHNKIKVVHIITSLYFGGAERLLFDLVSEIDRDKFDITVITVVDGGPLVADFVKNGVPVLVNKKNSWLGLGLVWRLNKQLREIKPDIVHTHLFGGDAWGRLAAIFARVPVIISTAHNSDMDEGRIKKIIKFILSFGTKKVVAVSRAVKDYVVEVEKIPASKMIVIYNGVRREKFFDAEPSVFENSMVRLAVIARLAEQKGHDILLEAAAKMKNKNVLLRFLGSGPLEAALKTRASELGIAKRVEFLGAQSDVAAFLKQTDIVVLPSRWEGLGLVLIEASLSARPIVAARVGGVPEVIEDKKNGLLVPANNPERLAQAIDWLIDHPKEARAMGWRACNNAERFDLGQMVANYEKLYLQLCQSYSKA